MHASLTFLASTLLATTLLAQSPLTTTFASNNGGAAGGAVYFDLDVTAGTPLLITGLDLNFSAPANTAGTVEIYTCPGSRTGNQSNPGAWTLVSSGSVLTAGRDTPTAVALTPFTLPPGPVGIALKAISVGHAYTNGNGSNQVYGNADLTLTAGEASNVAFSTAILTPRVANCRFHYDRTVQTLLAPNNGGALGGAVYFDVDVTNPAGITLTGMSTILTTSLGTLGTVDVYTCPTSYVGNPLDRSRWSLVGTGTTTSTGSTTPTVVALAHPIQLGFGTVGVALVASSGFRYTNGTGSNQVYSNGDLILSCGAASNTPFTAPLFTPRVANLSLLYQTGANGPQATRSNYGVGCNSQVASFYETTAPAAFDLNFTSLTISHGSTTTGVAGGGTFVNPPLSATQLVLGDDAVVTTPTLAVPFPHLGGTSSQLHVCSNGFVAFDGNNGNSWTPSATAMLAMPRSAWFCWHDYNPSIPAGGKVYFHQSGGVAYVTWLGVWNYNGTSAADANTFQFQFDANTGAVRLAIQQMANSGSNYLVGYSPGGPSANPGNRDLSAALGTGFLLSTTDQNLTLDALQRPIPGNVLTMQTSGVNPNTLFGAVILGLTSFPTGVNLDGIGMTGCFQYNDGAVSLPILIGNAPVQTSSFPVPNVLGLAVYAQSVIYCPASGLNPLGASASGGLELRVGAY